MQTIGERLEEARKRKGVSIREAAEATKIRGDYLHRFENNQFDLSLPEIYVRGFLRTYATFLKLPSDKIVNDYKGLGLGLAENKRGLNRESFGRMDISVSSAKSAAREASPPPAPTHVAEAAPDTGPADNNPATFRPRAGAGPQIDQSLVIKGLMAAGGVAVLVVIILLLVRFFSSDPTRPSTASNANPATTVKAGEAAITVYALDNVFVTLRQRDDNLLLFSGSLTRGESRSVPWRTTVRVDADPFEAVDLEINGIRHKMPKRTADVEKVPANAPASGR